MTDPVASAAQLINAIDKLIKSWGLGIILLLSPLFFVWGLNFDWFDGLPIIISVLGAIGAGAVTFKILELCWTLFASVGRNITYELKQSRLTDDQYAILKMCLVVDRPWRHLSVRGNLSALDDAVQRFLEANLGYMDVSTFRFTRDYWVWINKRRRNIIAKEIPEEVAKKYNQNNANPNEWMAN